MKTTKKKTKTMRLRGTKGSGHDISFVCSCDWNGGSTSAEQVAFCSSKHGYKSAEDRTVQRTDRQGHTRTM
jgi:hypothetical protein